jgi:hypothetical protein
MLLLTPDTHFTVALAVERHGAASTAAGHTPDSLMHRIYACGELLDEVCLLLAGQEYLDRHGERVSFCFGRLVFVGGSHLIQRALNLAVGWIRLKAEPDINAARLALFTAPEEPLVWWLNEAELVLLQDLWTRDDEDATLTSAGEQVPYYIVTEVCALAGRRHSGQVSIPEQMLPLYEAHQHRLAESIRTLPPGSVPRRETGIIVHGPDAQNYLMDLPQGSCTTMGLVFLWERNERRAPSYAAASPDQQRTHTAVTRFLNDQYALLEDIGVSWVAGEQTAAVWERLQPVLLLALVNYVEPSGRAPAARPSGLPLIALPSFDDGGSRTVYVNPAQVIGLSQGTAKRTDADDRCTLVTSAGEVPILLPALEVATILRTGAYRTPSS